jgi:hypothetical protein
MMPVLTMPLIPHLTCAPPAHRPRALLNDGDGLGEWSWMIIAVVKGHRGRWVLVRLFQAVRAPGWRMSSQARQDVLQASKYRHAKMR